MENNGMIETHQQFLLHRLFFHVIEKNKKKTLGNNNRLCIMFGGNTWTGAQSGE